MSAPISRIALFLIWRLLSGPHRRVDMSVQDGFRTFDDFLREGLVEYLDVNEENNSLVLFPLNLYNPWRNVTCFQFSLWMSTAFYLVKPMFVSLLLVSCFHDLFWMYFSFENLISLSLILFFCFCKCSIQLEFITWNWNMSCIMWNGDEMKQNIILLLSFKMCQQIYFVAYCCVVESVWNFFLLFDQDWAINGLVGIQVTMVALL